MPECEFVGSAGVAEDRSGLRSSGLRRWAMVIWITQLKRPDIRDDPPAVVLGDPLVIAVHSAVAVGDDVIEVSRQCIAQAIQVIRRRLGKAALHDHAISVAQSSVAGGTKYFELLVAGFQILP